MRRLRESVEPQVAVHRLFRRADHWSLPPLRDSVGERKRDDWRSAMKVPRREMGVHEMEKAFGVGTKGPDKGGVYGPSMFDYQAGRNPLGYVPNDVVNRVIPADTGLPSTSGLGLASGAFADVTTGRCWKTPTVADKRVLPETHLPGSMNT